MALLVLLAASAMSLFVIVALVAIAPIPMLALLGVFVLAAAPNFIQKRP